MIHLEMFKVSVPFKKKFVISKGEASIKTNLLTVMNNRYNGEVGLSVYYGPSLDDIQSDIEKGLEYLRELDEINIDTLGLIDKYDIQAPARSALMGMILNYLSGESKRYPWEVLSLGSPVGIKSSVTVAVAEPNEMIEAIENSEYSIVKVKMGHEQDIMLLDALASIKNKEIQEQIKIKMGIYK